MKDSITNNAEAAYYSISNAITHKRELSINKYTFPKYIHEDIITIRRAH